MRRVSSMIGHAANVDDEAMRCLKVDDVLYCVEDAEKSDECRK
jgi:hypothetical protein